MKAYKVLSFCKLYKFRNIGGETTEIYEYTTYYKNTEREKWNAWKTVT